MFRQLKWKFILINMSLLTAVFIALIASAAALMIADNNRVTRGMLDRALTVREYGGFPRPMEIGTIVARTRQDGVVLVSSAPSQIPSDIIREALQLALAEQSERGNVASGGYEFAFAVLRRGNGALIALLDQTRQNNMLRSTLLILFGVSVGSLVVLFFVSVFFANRTIRPIRESFEKQKNFIADTSHELKTPLAILGANLSVVLSDQTQTVESQRKWLETMEDQIGRMSGLVSDMLSMARLDAQSDAEPLEPVDFSFLVNGCLLSFEAMLYERDIRLEADVTPGLSVLGTPETLGRLAGILMDNAVKHTPPAGYVAVRLTKGRSKTVLSVENTGEGIPPEALDHVFDRFYRADSSRARETGGVGLGLAIAKAIVDRLGGRIDAKSEGGRVIFTVELR